MRTTTRYLLALLVAVAALGAACGDDDGDKADAGESKPAESEPKAAKTSCEPAGPGEEAVTQRGKPSVVVPDPVPSELQVTDLVEGTGAEVVPGGTLEVQYVVTSSEGAELDSSWEAGTPLTVPLKKLSTPFARAFEGMKEGGRRQLVISAEDLLGGHYPEGVEAGDMLVMVVDLVSVSDEDASAQKEPEADRAALAAAKQRGAPEVTVPSPFPTELKVIDDVVGTGDIVCEGDQVLAHYVGVDASSGEEFDSSWTRGEPAAFGLDQVVDGWSQGLVGMKVGGRRTLVVPAALAYGENATDTPGTPTGDLVFTVDLVGVG